MRSSVVYTNFLSSTDPDREKYVSISFGTGVVVFNYYRL